MTNIVIELFNALGLPEAIVKDIDARAYVGEYNPWNDDSLAPGPDYDSAMSINQIMEEFLFCAFVWEDSPYRTFYSDVVTYNLDESKFDSQENITKLNEYIKAKSNGVSV